LNPNITALLDEAVSRLKRTGAENPVFDAEAIFSEVLNVPRLELRIFCDREMLPAEIEKISELLARRESGEPLQYIFGAAHFRKLTLHVAPGVLIPRPETEMLVDLALESIPERASICDIGTGSGAIALSLAYERPDSRVFAVDISQAALSLAGKNQAVLHLENVAFVCGDLLDSFKKERCFDLIAANLPYVTSLEYESLPREVRDHEPENALRAGDDGLDVIARLIQCAPDYMREGGRLIIEFGPGQTERIRELFDAAGRYKMPELVKDLSGRDRFFTVRIW